MISCLGSAGCQSATERIRRGEPVLFGNLPKSSLHACIQSGLVRPLWRVAGKLPLPRRGGFQSALLVGGLETAAPCVGASRLTHVSPLMAYTTVAAYGWVAPGV